MAEAFAAATGSSAPVHEAGGQDAHEHGHAQETDPAHHAGQHGLGQQAWQLRARGVNLQAWARGHEGGSVSMTLGDPGPPIPRALPCSRVLTRGGDVGCVAGITDIATGEGHEAEFVENVLGIGVQGGGQGSALPAPSPFGKTLQLEGTGEVESQAELRMVKSG